MTGGTVPSGLTNVKLSDDGCWFWWGRRWRPEPFTQPLPPCPDVQLKTIPFTVGHPTDPEPIFLQGHGLTNPVRYREVSR